MNDQERQVIEDIFRRIETVADQPCDPEAERLIADKVRRQPYAPYAMAQALYVQEQALASLNQQLEEARVEIDQMRRQPQGAGGFLSGLFGGGPRAPEPPRASSPSSPWGRASVPQVGSAWNRPLTGHGLPRGGGFLQSALATAAGVAGGMMIANALTSAFGQNNPLEQASALAGDATSPHEDLTSGLHQEASLEDQGFDDPGFDGGDGGDWA